jgi:hypothetical protein
LTQIDFTPVKNYAYDDSARKPLRGESEKKVVPYADEKVE